jgi:hypothetical protein
LYVGLLLGATTTEEEEEEEVVVEVAWMGLGRGGERPG